MSPAANSGEKTVEPRHQDEAYLDLLSGNRPSHEGAAEQLNPSIALCRQAGFRKIVLRGDTDFSQTKHLDGWHESGVSFV